MPADQSLALLGVGSVAGVGSAVSTLEWIYNRRQLAAGGLYDWQVVGNRHFAVRTGWRARLVNETLEYPRYVAVLALRFAATAVLPFCIWRGDRSLTLGVLTLVVATTLLVNLRSVYGMDGSDQMTTQVYGALFLGYASGTTLGLDAALWYIALQACFSYFTSGLAKALSPQWRRGAAVLNIFNTRTYGFEPVARVLRSRPRLSRCVDWSAFIVEMAFPLALVVGYPVVLLFVVWGVAFHAMNAAVMGLNSFLWAFAATYPAVIYVSMAIAGSHPFGWPVWA